MARKKRVRLISEMACKIRAYRELKAQPRESEKYALDYKTMKRPYTGKTLPVLSWEDVGRENCLFTLLSGLRLFGVGRIFTRKSWLSDHQEPSYWQITKVKVDYIAENMDHGRAWGILTYKGKKESEVQEVEKVMYHDWRMIPKHEEEKFKQCEMLQQPPVRHVIYPPLLRAMILAQQKKDGEGAEKEPTLPLKRDILLSKDYFSSQEKEQQRQVGTPV